VKNASRYAETVGGGRKCALAVSSLESRRPGQFGLGNGTMRRSKKQDWKRYEATIPEKGRDRKKKGDRGCGSIVIAKSVRKKALTNLNIDREEGGGQVGKKIRG